MRLGVARATLAALPLHAAALSPTRPRFLEEGAAKERDAEGRSEAERPCPAAAAAREGPVLASAAMASISSSSSARKVLD